MQLEQYLKVVEKFLADKLTETKMDGYVLGLSGGVDSATVAGLAKAAVGADKLFLLLMPCHSHPIDLELAEELAKKFKVQYAVVDLSKTYDVLMEDLEKKAVASGKGLNELARINTKVRLRMVTLYAFAAGRHAMVLGTDNWDENYTGYFTKYGDGGVDLLPIAELTKGEVRAAARYYGVIEPIITRAPTAGLYTGQTDEGEMGVTYDELDQYLLGKKLAPEKVAVIERLHAVSAHKRDPLPRPAPFIRG